MTTELNPFIYDAPLPPDQVVDREPETELGAAVCTGPTVDA